MGNQGEGRAKAGFDVDAAGELALASGPGEIVDEGETGRVVPANDSDALAAALGEMLAHPEQTRSLAERAAKRAEDFSVGGISRAYWELFAS